MDTTIYYNLNLLNTNEQPLQATVIDQRAGNIIENPSQWEMSIVRFQISSALIPIFIPKIPDPAFPNTTDMSITLSYGLNTVQAYIEVSDLQVKGVFSYSVLLERLNTAAKLAFLAIADPGITSTSAPQFYLDETTSLISMYVQSDYLSSNANRVRVYLNQEMMTLINLPYSEFNGGGAIDGTDYLLDIFAYAKLLPPNGSRIEYPFGIQNVVGNVLRISQEYPSLNKWNGYKSIVFVSNNIPTNSEYLPNVTGPTQNQTFSESTQNILSDYDLDQHSSRSSIIDYVPSSEYRMKSMRSRNPFSAIDCTAMLQGYDGKITPIYLLKGTSMNIKVMFRRR